MATGRATMGTPASAWLLMLAALGAVFLGLITLTQATMGVGFIGGACVLAIWARLAQAAAFHKELMTKLEQRADQRPYGV